MNQDDEIRRAADAIREAAALLVTAGAGVGVDSGLPDFRGTKGFWNAYPAYRHLGLSFVELANPRWFRDDPKLAWGFYGHRLNLYRSTPPHPGFDILRRWGRRMTRGVRIFTSNVDGHFQRAGIKLAKAGRFRDGYPAGLVSLFSDSPSGFCAVGDQDAIDMEGTMERIRIASAFAQALSER